MSFGSFRFDNFSILGAPLCPSAHVGHILPDTFNIHTEVSLLMSLSNVIYPYVRLFNDPVAMILLYAAINLFIDDHWSLGSFCFSLAV